MNKVIGIISWLPDDEKMRKIRIERLNTLIVKCDELFNLPILIVAQNWKNDVKISSNCIIHKYDKLGITGARIKLRELFLATTYEIIIMLDDDCEIAGNAARYLQQIEEHGVAYGTFGGTLLKLFSIHRDLFAQVNFDPDLNAENGDGYEDACFVGLLDKKYPDKHFGFTRTGIADFSNSWNDTNSTWDKMKFKRVDMANKTHAWIQNIK